ncbi:hypothetical protein CH249_06980 [Rhodococcus sp. 05-2255-3B1]|uniref:SIR2 family protein n=1 Tax=unclassified Rhodococcus (in: high G+C Gram-positive bacteria) TaxID=192944 RepID=UPI000B9B2D65|nr:MULTISPECIES: SIR2 family protein [unclassified Rhodococcus (in: high G+C Gram-positive bacteria)]OZE11010.1 hypothetical protein CH250_11035 [Rhodococcus sp. 05-2255-3C]OZE14167.1 hypothetical protein CH249_06980 [Rhodococcus sp. 05-2255-3B1]OZE24738.1 hypothetical protein CH255_00855 [Rhodococcus sp. 05-2255-2A2]
MYENEKDTDFCHQFFERPALSFSNQPNFRDLLVDLVDPTKNFTFVLGAGVSLDSELPSWNQLIANMTREIEDPTWREAATLDSEDLLRKAESVLQFVNEGTTATPERIVQQALYKTPHGKVIREPVPGRLAGEVAKLCSFLGDRAYIATTNFDVLLETAIEDLEVSGDSKSEINPVAFDPLVFEDEDRTIGEHPGWTAGNSVLHLHGVLKPNRDPAGNLVLTESDFLEFGPRIRDFVRERLIVSHVVFIGVSMTDPNLVSPLWSLHKSREEYMMPFLLTVASPRVAINSNSARAYEIKKAEYLSRLLNVKTVFFKSYGQQAQAIADASLACFAPEDYIGNDDPTESRRYGYRLSRTLDLCYRNLGCGDDLEFPGKDATVLLSDRLHELLNRDGGVQSLLTQAVDNLSRTKNESRAEIYRQFKDSLTSERFGIFLWLRSRSASAEAESYKLKLLGTSVYTHREGWSLNREAEVGANSEFICARAAYSGRFTLADVKEVDQWQLWRSIWAVPFSRHAENDNLDFGNTFLDAIDIGVITLNSTCRAVPPKDGNWEPGTKRSILSALTKDETSQIERELIAIAQEVVDSPLT